MEKEKEQLVVNNLGLVYDVVHKNSSKILSIFEYEDAIQMGMVALIRAANTYDNTKQTAFSTYAHTCIRNHLYTQLTIAIRKKNGYINVSLDDTLIDSDEGFSLMSLLSDEFNLVDEHIKNNQIELLYKYIDEIEDKLQKDILSLRLENVTFDNISKILNTDIKIIYKNYNKALNILRNKFK